MSMLQKTCMLYVDYTDLVLNLSRVPYFDILAVLDALQHQARQRFYIQEIHVYSTWMLDTTRKQLEEQRIVCDTVAEAESPIAQTIHEDVVSNLVSPLAADAYILISGISNFLDLLRALQRAQRQTLLWTYIAPEKQERQFAEWQRILLPSGPVRTLWARSIMLQAIALAADHLQVDAETPLLISKMQTHMMRIDAFRSSTDAWITVAISEQLLLPVQPGGRSRSTRGYITLNRNHRLVQKALALRERIMITLSMLLIDREWVAFNVLEQALRTEKQLADDQRTRQAWIEVLIAEKVLIALRLPRPDDQYEVTTLRLNREHPQALILQRYQRQNLFSLIIAMQTFMERRQTDWQAISNLLRTLTGEMTHVEARGVLSAAIRQEAVILESIANPRDKEHPVAAASLNMKHRIVREAIEKRNRALLDCDEILTEHPRGTLSKSQLEELFSRMQGVSRDEARFWIALLLREELLLTHYPAHDANDQNTTIYLNKQDSVIKNLLR